MDSGSDKVDNNIAVDIGGAMVSNCGVRWQNFRDLDSFQVRI